jgi:hypothetical protein
MPKDKPINQETHIRYGICDGYLFIQVATYHDHIIWEGKTKLSDKPTKKEIKNLIPKLFESFKKKELGLFKEVTHVYHIDGLMIIETGKIHTRSAEKVGKIYSDFWEDVTNYLFLTK